VSAALRVATNAQSLDPVNEAVVQEAQGRMNFEPDCDVACVFGTAKPGVDYAGCRGG